MPRPAPLLAAALAACTPVAKPEAVPNTPNPPPASPAPTPTPPASPAQQFLSTHHLTHELPPGYREVEIPPDDRWAHTIAIRSTTQDLEIRLGPAAHVEDKLRATCTDDPRCRTAPSQTALAEILRAAVAPLAVPASERAKEFPLDAVRNEFSAHWGGAVGFDVDPAFSTYKRGLAVVIFREGRGAAMSVTLMPEVTDASEDERMRAFHTLRFAEPFTATLPEHATLAGTYWHCNEFSYLRFEPTTLTLMTLSAPMLVMGQRIPYETEYTELTWLPANRLSAVPFRVDNFEQGDRTPKSPTATTYTHDRKADTLTFKADPWTDPWFCTLVQR